MNIENDYWTSDEFDQRSKTPDLKIEILANIITSSTDILPPKLLNWFAYSSGHYLLIDAARCDQVIGLDDIEIFANGHCCRSLFRDVDYAHIGPWLIDLDLTKYEAKDRSDHYLLQRFFQKLWGQRVGIFMRTDASFNRLFSHLRTFVMVGNDTGKEATPLKTYFRYWDPLVAGVYFPGICKRSDRVDRLLKTADGYQVELLIEDGPSNATTLTFPEREELSNNPLKARNPLILDTQDKALLKEVAFRALGHSLSEWFLTAFPDRVGQLTKEGLEKAAQHVVATGRKLGFDLKEEYSYLAHVMVHFGGWFFEVPANPSLNKALFDKGAVDKHETLAKVFSSAWDASIPAILARRRSEVIKWLSNLPEGERVSPEALNSLCVKLFGDRTTACDALIVAARLAAQAAGFSTEKEGQHILMSLFFGHRYQNDYFRPWSDLPLDEALDSAWLTAFKGA